MYKRAHVEDPADHVSVRWIIATLKNEGKRKHTL